jgi:hypothetical protein
VEAVIGALGRARPRDSTQQADLEREVKYFRNNAERMRYSDFRKRALFVGSGVVEAGCKTVVGQRLKRSGMHWTVRGANAIMALRCLILSGRWEPRGGMEGEPVVGKTGTQSGSRGRSPSHTIGFRNFFTAPCGMLTQMHGSEERFFHARITAGLGQLKRFPCVYGTPRRTKVL